MKNVSAIIEELQRERESLKKEYEDISKKAENMKYKLESLSEAIKNLKNAYSSTVSSRMRRTRYNRESKPDSKPVRPIDKLNFTSIITHILKKHNHPLTSRQLQDYYNGMVDEDEKKHRNTFSGMISYTYNKTNKIDRTELSEIKGRSKFVYGLPAWFDENGNLKQEFINRMKTETDLFAK